MCFMPFRNLYRWGPLATLVIIKLITFSTIYCNSLWWPAYETIGGFLNSSLFFTLCFFTLINFFASVFDGPGYLPMKWRPEDQNNIVNLQYCYSCLGYKAPRSHHCRKCNRCVLKMDHHCPWINNCVGYKNQGHFILFLFFAVCACCQSTVILSNTLFKSILTSWYYYYRGDPNVIVLRGYIFLILVLSLGLGVGVIIGVGALLFFQIRGVLKNETNIEEWIIEKAVYRRKIALAHGEPLEPFIFPYDLGAWKNFRQVFNWEMKPSGNGIDWPIHPECNQFTLTKEQLEQKRDKKQRAKVYAVIRDYSGRFFPFGFGFRVLCCSPYTDESRLSLSVGNLISVTRVRKYWLFGEKRFEGGLINLLPEKGWFPRCCVVEVDLLEDYGADSNEEPKKDN